MALMTVIRAESGLKFVLRNPDHPEPAAAKSGLIWPIWLQLRRHHLLRVTLCGPQLPSLIVHKDRRANSQGGYKPLGPKQLRPCRLAQGLRPLPGNGSPERYRTGGQKG